MATSEHSVQKAYLRAIRLTGRITGDGHLDIRLPAGIEEGEAEVIVLIQGLAPPPTQPIDRKRWLKEAQDLRGEIGPLRPLASELLMREREESPY